MNEGKGVLSSEEVRGLYDRIADRYDLMLLSLKPLGMERERKRLIADLRLQTGDHVVDLCGGTGKNLSMLVAAVGPTGRVTVVDLSPRMLHHARSLADKNGWTNVEFVQADVETYTIPSDAAAVLSTFGLEMVPGYDRVISGIASTLGSGACVGLLGLKHPESWPEWLVDVGVLLMRPFGVNQAYRDFRPWRAAERHLNDVRVENLAFGAAYRCVGLIK